jgi:hypothetical protein
MKISPKEKEAFLAWRRQRNRSITSLTPAQHDALELLTEIRHTMHTNQNAFINADNPLHPIFAQYILDDNDLSINQFLSNTGLPCIVFPVDIYRVFFRDTVSRNDFQTDYEYLTKLNMNLDKDYNTTEALNTTIENYLRWIDSKYNTIYCPFAKHRVHINRGKETDRILTQIQNQTLMMDMDLYRHGYFPVVPKIDIMASERPVTVKQRLFVDLDGTLAAFRAVHSTWELFDPGYYEGLLPNWNVLYAIKDIIKYHYAEIDVHVISSAPSNAVVCEKNDWLNLYLPELDTSHRVFCLRNIDRTLAVPGGLYSDDFLLDDNTRNLSEWDPPARAVKLLNGLNHWASPWPGDCLRHDRYSNYIRDKIVCIMKYGEHVRDGY